MNFSRMWSFRPIEWLLVILLLLAPVYFHPNIGGTGLRIPNNIIIWAMASLVGFYSLFKLSRSQHIVLPRYFMLLLAFPSLAFFSSTVSGVEIASQWTFRVLYIWGGVLFFFSLFQHDLKQGRIDRLLFIVVLSGLIHSLFGLSQIIWLKQLPSFLPVNPNGVPTGLFQQINNQASFQVTSILIALWLSSRPFIRKGPQWRFILLIIAMGCGAFVVSYSGSRVGALGFILALPLLLLSRWQTIKQEPKRIGLIVAVLIISVSSASMMESNRGLTSALEKSAAINAGFSGSARLGMYAIALDVIKKEPLLGHGIGSFVRVWQFGKPAFYAQHPDATLPAQRVAHPHNEIIFWLVEGGIVAVTGLVLCLIAVLFSLKRLPHSRRYAYAALILPITLHTQVELPFYISSGHWFVFLLLLFVLFHPSHHRYQLKLSDAARYLIKGLAVCGALLSIVFLSHTMAANLEFKRSLMKQVPAGEEPFPIAMNNPYFKTLASHTVMTSLLHSSIQYKLDENVWLFAQWAEEELKYNPHILFYRLTARAYTYLKQDDNLCKIGRKGKAIYPTDPLLIKVVEICDKKSVP